MTKLHSFYNFLYFFYFFVVKKTLENIAKSAGNANLLRIPIKNVDGSLDSAIFSQVFAIFSQVFFIRSTKQMMVYDQITTFIKCSILFLIFSIF